MVALTRGQASVRSRMAGRRGWASVRDASAAATLGLCINEAVAAAYDPARRHSSSATG